MKFLKILFSRFTIISLLVILQVAIFVSAIVFLDKFTPYYFVINAVFTVLSMLFVFILINRQTNPNYIVPWVVILLLLPTLGVVVFLMFSQNKLRRRQKNRYGKLFAQTIDYVPQSQRVMQKLDEENPQMAGQSKYLLSVNKLPVYDSTHTKYFSSGESFFEALKDEIKTARHFIFMEFFTVQKGMMWNTILDLLIQKVQEGVEVRFMYDDIGCIKTLSSGYWKKLKKEGIKCVKFNRFKPIATAVHNNRDHRKIIVIDGKAGFVTGANLGDTYINVVKKYGYLKDSALLLKGTAVKNLTVMFLQNFNAQTNDCEDYSPYLYDIKVETKEDLGYVQPFGDGPLPLYSERVSQNAILNLVNQARSHVYITTPYLIIDFQLTEAIKSAAKRGVDIRIVTPHIPDKKTVFLMTRSSYRKLIAAGVKIFEYTPGFIHSKIILVDGEVAIVGTINLDYRSLVHHFECGVWMYRTPSISEIRQDFLSVFAASHEVSFEESRQGFFARIAKTILQLFAPLL